MKWQKVTGQYLSKYEELMLAFFEELRGGRVRVRIMFRQAAMEAVDLTSEQVGSIYWLLYYQFIKHAFGLRFIPTRPGGTRLRLYFDQFPDTGPQVTRFKDFIGGLGPVLSTPTGGFRIASEDITEVRSHEHVLLQCLDVVLGAMAFRLNDMHLVVPAGARRRGRRTVAKEALYKLIRREICDIMRMPHFNIGKSTGHQGDPANRWRHPYRHWSFRPNDAEFVSEKTKGRRRKNPV